MVEKNTTALSRSTKLDLKNAMLAFSENIFTLVRCLKDDFSGVNLEKGQDNLTFLGKVSFGRMKRVLQFKNRTKQAMISLQGMA